MKIRLSIRKDNAELYNGVHEIGDAESFGAACAEAWGTLRDEHLRKETSIGALMENFDGNVALQILGATIGLEPA